MRKIKLTQNKYTLIDNNWFDYLSSWSWYFDGRYAVREARDSEGVGRKLVYMHRVVMGDPYNTNGLEVDHKDSNGLDNRNKNLRWATRAENCRNKVIRSCNTSGYVGVSFHKGMKKWRARIWVNKVEIIIGYFISKDDAALAYNDSALKYFGKFAKLKAFIYLTHLKGNSYVIQIHCPN